MKLVTQERRGIQIEWERTVTVNRRPTRQAKGEGGFTLIELMVVVAILGIVAAIAVPNYIRYMAKSRQAEARTNLGGIFVSELTFFGEFTRYDNFQLVGFTLAGGSNRYAYRVGAGATAGTDLIVPGIGADPGDNTIIGSGIAGVPAPGFTATATANLDNDASIDMWHVNDLKRGLGTPDNNDATT